MSVLPYVVQQQLASFMSGDSVVLWNAVSSFIAGHSVVLWRANFMAGDSVGKYDNKFYGL